MAVTLAEVFIYNCPDNVGDSESKGCANRFMVLGGARHIAFDKYPLSLSGEDILAVDYFTPYRYSDRLFQHLQGGIARGDQSRYTQILLQRLEDGFASSDSAKPAYSRFISGVLEEVEHQFGDRDLVRQDGPVTAFLRSYQGRMDVYTVDASELNGCGYGFEALEGSEGRIRLGVQLSDSARRF